MEVGNIFKFINFFHRNSYGYDGMKMLECVLLAFAVNGYASVRKPEEDHGEHPLFFYVIIN